MLVTCGPQILESELHVELVKMQIPSRLTQGAHLSLKTTILKLCIQS